MSVIGANGMVSMRRPSNNTSNTDDSLLSTARVLFGQDDGKTTTTTTTAKRTYDVDEDDAAVEQPTTTRPRNDDNIGGEIMFSSNTGYYAIPGYPDEYRRNIPRPDGRTGFRSRNAPFGPDWLLEERKRMLIVATDAVYQFVQLVATHSGNARVQQFWSYGTASSHQVVLDMLLANAVNPMDKGGPPALSGAGSAELQLESEKPTTMSLAEAFAKINDADTQRRLREFDQSFKKVDETRERERQLRQPGVQDEVERAFRVRQDGDNNNTPSFTTTTTTTTSRRQQTEGAPSARGGSGGGGGGSGGHGQSPQVPRVSLQRPSSALPPLAPPPDAGTYLAATTAVEEARRAEFERTSGAHVPSAPRLSSSSSDDHPLSDAQRLRAVPRVRLLTDCNNNNDAAAAAAAASRAAAPRDQRMQEEEQRQQQQQQQQQAQTQQSIVEQLKGYAYDKDGRLVGNLDDKYVMLLRILLRGATKSDIEVWKMLYQVDKESEESILLSDPASRYRYLRDLLKIQQLLARGEGDVGWTQAAHRTGYIFFTETMSGALSAAMADLNTLCGKGWAPEIDLMTHSSVRDQFARLVAYFIRRSRLTVMTRLGSTSAIADSLAREHIGLIALFKRLQRGLDGFLCFSKSDVFTKAQRHATEDARLAYMMNTGNYYTDNYSAEQRMQQRNGATTIAQQLLPASSSSTVPFQFASSSSSDAEVGNRARSGFSIRGFAANIR
jgi:hypothetical protein